MVVKLLMLLAIQKHVLMMFITGKKQLRVTLSSYAILDANFVGC